MKLEHGCRLRTLLTRNEPRRMPVSDDGAEVSDITDKSLCGSFNEVALAGRGSGVSIREICSLG